MAPRKRIWLYRGAALGFLLVFLAQGLGFIAANSQTADEAAHLVVGYSYWAQDGNDRLNPIYPPLVRAVLALPVYLWYGLPLDPVPLSQRDNIWHIGRDFLYTSSVPGDCVLSLARLPNLFLGTALVGLVGLWAWRLWGNGAGLLAMALAALEPNLVAHSSVVTTDLGQTLFIFLTVYLLWEYTARPSGWLLAALGVSTGLALASKHLTILLVGMVAVLLVGEAVFGKTAPWPWLARQTVEPLPRRLGAAALALGATLVLAAGVVEVIHTPGGVLEWFEGFWIVLSLDKRGHPAFFLGQYSDGGWWHYFLVAFALKTPLGSLLLILAALLLLRSGQPLTWRQAAFLLLPVAIWLAVMSRAGINIGLRHILPVYPFLFVIAGRLATVRLLRRAWLNVLLVGLPLLATGASSLRVAPHQLAYFNELVGGPAQGYRYLSDSNLDWGQDLKGLKAFMDREGVSMIYLAHYDMAPPAAYGIRYQHLPAYGPLGPPPRDLLPLQTGRELLAISAMNLQGVHFPDKNRYWWLLDREPVARIGYSIFVYDVTGDVDAHLRLTQIYVKRRLRTPAAHELRKVLALDPGNADAKPLLYLHQEP
jgi:hypothetical protein